MKKSVGRPSMGITKKVSITLDELVWGELEYYKDLKGYKSVSEMLREVIMTTLSEVEHAEPTPQAPEEKNMMFVRHYATGGKVHIKNTNYKTYCGSQITQESIVFDGSISKLQEKIMCKNCVRLF